MVCTGFLQCMIKLYFPLVGDAPEVLSPLKDKTGVAGNPIKLECDITPGTPQASIKWYLLYKFCNIL